MPEVFVRVPCRVAGRVRSAGDVLYLDDAECDRLLGLGLCRLATSEDALPPPPPEVEPEVDEFAPPPPIATDVVMSTERVLQLAIERLYALEALVAELRRGQRG